MSYRYKIIDASAGTGKTFSLRKNILLKLFSGDDFSFKHVLAVTFTNNASNEMKQSILYDLFVISTNPKNSKVLSEINKEFEIKNVKQKSQKLLKNILNNFSFFQISTLDKFNHRLIRSFSNELGLGYDFDIIVDRDEFFDLLIFEFLDKIQDNSTLLTLLSNYSKTKVLLSKSWDIDYEIRELLELIFDETNYLNFLELSENQNLNLQDLKKDILKKIKGLQTSIKKKCNEFFLLIDQNSEHVFVYLKNFVKSISIKKINDLKTEAIRSRIFNNQILKKSFSGEQNGTYSNAISNVVGEILSIAEKIKTYSNIFSNIDLNTLAIEIIKFSNEYQDKSNILFISDFNKKINKELLEQPSQYIYEKLSVKFKDYFIDEFQDTSFLQWQNIIPLSSHSVLNEGVNENHGSIFLVGDPKQSIYRWRGANPEIFSSLKQTSPFHIKPQLIPKKINFRSCEKIVNFNNDFFKFISSKLMLDRVDELYKNLDQNSNKKPGGLTTITFIDQEKDYKEQTSLSVLNIIKDKIREGYDYKDIAILCRKNDQCSQISSFLIENNVDVRSDEISAFSSIEEVRILVRFLGLKVDPKNKEHIKEILKYYTHINNLHDKYDFIQNNLEHETEVIFSNIFDLDFRIFYGFSDYESIVYLINNLKFFDKNLLHIQFLLDEILNYELLSSYRKESFYSYWNKKKDKIKATFINNSNSVNVLTIHKAKGMEFNFVILPYFDFSLQESNFKTWIHYQSSKTTTPIFVDYKNSLKYFDNNSKVVFHDKNNEMILDSLNLMYVALSRAISQNHIITNTPKGENFSSVAAICHSYSIQNTNAVANVKASLYNFSWGNSNEQKSKGNFLYEKSIKTLCKVKAHDFNAVRKNLNRSKKTSYFGSVFHDVIAKIQSKKQIEIVINDFFNRGLFSKTEKNKMIKMVKSVFTNKKLSHFYINGNNIYSEREIYLSNGNVIKPDRMILYENNEVSILDYKTGKPKVSDNNQIINYISELEKNSYQVREAFLIYFGNKTSIIDLIND